MRALRRAPGVSAASRRAPLTRRVHARVITIPRLSRREPNRMPRECGEVGILIASTGDRGKRTEITEDAIDAPTADRMSCSFHTLCRSWNARS
jgi:hypothetical protein